MSILFSLCLALLCAWFLVKPWLTPISEGQYSNLPSNGQSLTKLMDQKQRCLQVLKDLDLDHATGKVSAIEFQQTREQLLHELSGITKQIDLDSTSNA